MSPPPNPSNFAAELSSISGCRTHPRAEQLRERVAGDVVLGRPEPAGDEHDVGALEREPEHLHDPRRVVADHLMVQDVDADLGEVLGHPPRVGVRDLPEEQLGPDADDLGPHAPADGVASALVPKLNVSPHDRPGAPGMP